MLPKLETIKKNKKTINKKELRSVNVILPSLQHHQTTSLAIEREKKDTVSPTTYTPWKGKGQAGHQTRGNIRPQTPGRPLPLTRILAISKLDLAGYPVQEPIIERIPRIRNPILWLRDVIMETDSSFFTPSQQRFEDEEETTAPIRSDLSGLTKKIFSKSKSPENCSVLRKPLTNPQRWSGLKTQ